RIARRARATARIGWRARVGRGAGISRLDGAPVRGRLRVGVRRGREREAAARVNGDRTDRRARDRRREVDRDRRRDVNATTARRSGRRALGTAGPVAVVVTFEIAIATDGTTATLPPAAPVFALTVATCVVEEASVRSWPPVSDPLRLAVVLSSITATPTDAPMPTEPTPVTPAPVGNASVAEVAFDAAAMRTSPAPALSVPSSDAFV